MKLTYGTSFLGTLLKKRKGSKVGGDSSPRLLCCLLHIYLLILSFLRKHLFDLSNMEVCFHVQTLHLEHGFGIGYWDLQFT